MRNIGIGKNCGYKNRTNKTSNDSAIALNHFCTVHPQRIGHIKIIDSPTRAWQKGKENKKGEKDCLMSPKNTKSVQD